VFTLLAILGVISVAGIAGSFVVSARDGYGRRHRETFARTVYGVRDIPASPGAGPLRGGGTPRGAALRLPPPSIGGRSNALPLRQRGRRVIG
jgi:hypothetical protein